MSEFKRGDVVRVKLPNAPVMKITRVVDGYADTFWFASDQKVQTGGFAVDELELVDWPDLAMVRPQFGRQPLPIVGFM